MIFDNPVAADKPYIERLQQLQQSIEIARKNITFVRYW
jgi:hypothetical protein